jgi:NTE family protein
LSSAANLAKLGGMQSSLESWLAEGPYTLSLCSHFFGFYSHTAIVEQLYKTNSLPTKITGTSAGALVGGALASGLAPKEFKDLLFSKTVQDYWDPQLGLGLLAGKKLNALLKSLFVDDFSQAHTPLEVGVAELPFFQMKFLSSGNLTQSVLASCAVPFLFPPVKVDRKWYYDGGLLQKSGMNPKDINERVLNIYLDSKNGAFEKEFAKQKKIWGPNHRILYFPKAPRVNLRNLTTGQTAYKETMKRAESILQTQFKKNVITF